jgi:hypothetical protein
MNIQRTFREHEREHSGNMRGSIQAAGGHTLRVTRPPDISSTRPLRVSLTWSRGKMRGRMRGRMRGNMTGSIQGMRRTAIIRLRRVSLAWKEGLARRFRDLDSTVRLRVQVQGFGFGNCEGGAQPKIVESSPDCWMKAHLIGALIGALIGPLIGPLSGALTDCSTGWSAEWSTDWSAEWSTDWSTDWTNDWTND